MVLPTKNFFQKGTIRSRLLVAFILLVLLPTFAVTFTNTLIDFFNGKKIITNQLLSEAEYKESRVNAWVDMLEKDLGIILTVTRIREISDPGKFFGTDGSELKNFQRNLNEIFETTGSFEEVFFLSPSGHVIISTDPDNVGQFRGHQTYFTEWIKGPGVHVQTDGFTSNLKEINKVIAVYPVHSATDKLIGVLCGSAGLRKLEEIMFESSGLSQTGETYLVGKNRVLLTKLRHADYIPGNFLMSSLGINLAVGHHENGSGIYKDYRGISVLGVYMWVPKMEVALLSEMDQLEAFGSVYLMIALNLGMAAFALIIAVILSAFFARGIADPLSELADTASRIANGELYLNVKQDHEDEVGALARAFNSMANQMSRRLDAYRLISNMSRKFISISPAKIDRAVSKSLKTFGQYYNADQGYVFCISNDSNIFKKTHEWYKEENGILMNQIQEVYVNDTDPWLINQLESMQVLHVPSVEELPLEAAAEKAQWLYKGIRSFICIPMVYGESLKGFIGFGFLHENRKIFEEDIRFLRMIGEIICNSLERQKTEAALKHSQERYALAQRAARIGSLDLNLITGKLHCSDTTWSIFGRQKEDLEATFDFFLLIVHPEDRDILNQAVQKSIEQDIHYDVEHRILLPDGSIRWVLITGAIIKNENDVPVRMIGMIRDITERKELAEKINASLKEKEVMLKEIHHRVKNNLQVISSLMYLQSKNIKDKSMAGIFKDCESRIRSMALVHERLYQSKSMAEIDFVEYIRSLAGYLLQSYGGGISSIRLETQIDKIFLDVNTAIPCGLIISELLSNSLKHAYPGGKNGEIIISFTQDESGTYTQMVKDNGIGLNENMDLQNIDTLGLRLVNILAKQLNGSLTYSGKDGTCFVLTFKEPVFSNLNY
jgi:PAS domain S-box-containing protein